MEKNICINDWLDYMTLQMNYQEKYEQGIDEGDRKRAISVAMSSSRCDLMIYGI